MKSNITDTDFLDRMNSFIGRQVMFMRSQQLLPLRISVTSYKSMLSKSASTDSQVSSQVTPDQNVSHIKSPPASSSLFPGYQPVFISPHIRHIRVACRLKVYQTGFVGLLLPTSMALTEQGYLLPGHVGYVAGI